MGEGKRAQPDIRAFQQYLEAEIIDPVGVHHEFGSKDPVMHGPKIDMDLILDDDPHYSQWVDVSEQYIREKYKTLPEVLIGVANGANRLALDTARRFGGIVIGLVSIKDEQTKQIKLSKRTQRVIAGLKPELVIVMDDVGTTGSNSVQVATKVLDLGAQNVEVLNTWQRRPQLEKLDEENIRYHALIEEPLPTYTVDECNLLIEGFCKQGWRLEH
jgi:orotate phosphoribosyltransferase